MEVSKPSSLAGQAPKSARDDFYYFNDDGLLVSYRYQDWKIVFCEQRTPGGFQVWADPFICLRAPKVPASARRASPSTRWWTR